MLMVLSALLGGFMVGVCVGAGAVEDMNGELRLPAAWWILPGAVLGGLLIAGIVIGLAT